MIAAQLYFSVYLAVVIILTIVMSLQYSKYPNSRLQHQQKLTNIGGYLWPVIFTVFIGLRPISYLFVDMVNYNTFYLTFSYGKQFHFTWDTENFIFDNLFNWLGSNFYEITIFFLIIATIYFIGTYVALRKIFPQDSVYAFIVFLAAFSTYSYGTNGIKAGAATAIFLCAAAYYRKPLICVLLMFLSLGFHHSMLVPIAAFVISYFFKNFKWHLVIWCITVLIALAHITYFQELFASLSGDDTVATNYLANESSNWGGKTGFRLDFVLYSSLPIVIGYYAIIAHKFKSRGYSIFLSTYTLSNAVWMLCMYASFTNRIAYLSWFMYPVLIIYPFLEKEFIPRQYSMLNKVVWLQLLFLLAMNFIYYA